MNLKLFSKTTRSESETTPLNMGDVSLDLRVSSIEGETVDKVDVNNTTKSFKFSVDYDLWKQETSLLSVNNFDNKYFNSIVKRGEESVPYIYEQLKKGPTHLVYALELIYPEKVSYNKQIITLKRARKIWLKILQEQLAR
jgi:hypothetical protein